MSKKPRQSPTGADDTVARAPRVPARPADVARPNGTERVVAGRCFSRREYDANGELKG